MNMTKDHYQLLIGLAVIAVAGYLVVVNRHKATSTVTGDIIQAATVQPSNPSLVGYVSYNIAPWGPRMQPFLPNNDLVNSANTSDLEYGSYYSS